MNVLIKKYFKSTFKNYGIFYYIFLILLIKSILLSVFLKSQYQIQYGDTDGFYPLFNFGIRSFLYYPGFILLTLCPILLLKNHVQSIWIIILDILFSAIFLIDLWYARAFNMVPSIHLVQMGDDLFTSLEGAKALIRLEDFILAFDVLPLALLSVFYRNKTVRKPANFINFGILTLLSVMLISGASYMEGIYKSSKELLYRSNTLHAAYEISPIGYLYYSTYMYFNERHAYPLSNQDKDRIKSWYGRNTEIFHNNEFKGLFKGMNLLLIQVESLEKFVIGREIEGQQITPNINRLLRNSIYFSNIYEQVKGGNSADAELLANASIYPVHIGTAFVSYPDRTFNSLPKILGNTGYHTTAIQPEKGSMWNWSAALKSMGFQRCIDSTSLKTDEKIGMGISDRSFLRQAASLIIQEQQPFYVFMVTLSSHVPFKLPVKYRNLVLDSKIDASIMGDYLQSINYTDAQLGVFIDELEQNGLLENTVIAIYGDHEGVHKYFQSDIINMEAKQDWWLYNNKQLPMLIYHKNLHGMEIQTVGGQVDIMPTIAYIMGVEQACFINTSMGRNLLNTKKSFAVLRDKSIIADVMDDSSKITALEGPDIADMIIRSNYFAEN